MASVQDGKQGEVYAILSNQTSAEAFCERYFNFSGAPGAFPPPIPAKGYAKFGEFGTKGAVLYDGVNPQNAPVSWILAWDTPKISPGAQLKVFTMCGTKSAMNNVTEQQILDGLEKSTAEDFANDPESKAYVKAEIGPGDNGGPAKLVATFTVSLN